MTDTRVGGFMGATHRPSRRLRPARARSLAPARFDRLFDFAAYLLFVCFLYKLANVAVVVLVGVIALGTMRAFRSRNVATWTTATATLYLASATITAFMVDFNEGVFRTFGFLLVVLSGIVLADHFASMTAERGRRVIAEFGLVVAAVYLHVIFYHVSIDRLSSWKWLFDTKTVISVALVLIFHWEDGIKRRFPGLWLPMLSCFAVFTLMSGERKAYILLAVLFLLSRASWVSKALVPMLAATAIGLYVASAPTGDYVSRQISTLFGAEENLQLADYYAVEDIQYRSDLIRDFVNINAHNLFLEHPILGVGATGYKDWAEATFGSFHESRGLSMNVHGEINRVPVEGGLVGIVIGLAYLVLVCRHILRHAVRTRLRTSANRTPVYVLGFVLIFGATEAMDTSMLMLIFLFAFYASNIGAWKRNSALRRNRLLARRAAGVDHLSRPPSLRLRDRRIGESNDPARPGPRRNDGTLCI
jgi:hypothetical protein